MFEIIHFYYYYDHHIVVVEWDIPNGHLPGDKVLKSLNLTVT